MCVPGLEPGQTYFVELGHKGYYFDLQDMIRPTDGVYRLDVSATSSCGGMKSKQAICCS